MVNKRTLKRTQAHLDDDSDVLEIDTLGTAALTKLQSKEERRLLDVVDKLRRTGLQGTIELPQLVVCGDQSSGKSSLLEAITEIPFPRNTNLCTRFATEIILRRESKITVTVKIVPSQDRTEAEKKRLSAFANALTDIRQLPDVIDVATREMGLGKVGASRAFTRDVLSITICGPERPQLTLVDLPGLIQAATKQASPEDIKLIHSLVGEYMSNPRTIILAVVTAKNDAANQCILKKFKDVDPKGTRTLGIITKPDSIGAGEEEFWFNLVQNKEIFLERGWHMIKNPGPGKQPTVRQRNDAEEVFFNDGLFKNLPRDIVGISALVRRLSSVLLRHLTQELPSLQREMQLKLDSTNTELLQLGEKRETPAEQRMVLMKIATRINHIISSAVNGHYLHDFFEGVDLDVSVDSGINIRRFRAVIQNLNHEFAETMRLRGHTYNVESEEEREQKVKDSEVNANGITTASGRKAEGPKPVDKDTTKQKKKKKCKKASTDDSDDGLPTPRDMSYDDSMTWVKDMIIRCRGHELPGSVNPEVTSHLFWEQSEPWAEIAQDHIAKVRDVCRDFVCQILENAAPIEFKKPLEDLLITSALEDTLEDAKEEFSRLMQDHARHPSTYDHCYSDSLQKKRNKKHTALTLSARHAATTTHLMAEGGMPAATHFDADVFSQIMTKAVERNMMTFAAEEALESQTAYYADELKYFVRAITKQVIERCMIDPLPSKLLSPMVVTAMSDEQVEFIAGELPETTAQRAFLEERKTMLETGFNIFRNAMGGVKRIHSSL